MICSYDFERVTRRDIISCIRAAIHFQKGRGINITLGALLIVNPPYSCSFLSVSLHFLFRFLQSVL